MARLRLNPVGTDAAHGRSAGKMWKCGHTFPRTFIRASRSTASYSRPWVLNVRAAKGRSMTAAATSRRLRRDRWVKFRAGAEEVEAIAAQARAVGMSVGAYLRAVGAGHQPRAVVDRDRIDAMLKINGDLGRLGGLLKLWLRDDAKLNQFDRGQVRQAILATLRRIEENQTALRDVIRRAMRDGGEP
jgi:hypothetical protein